MDRFYVPEITPSTNWLTDDEAHHLIKVHRKRIGDQVELFDGNGKIASATISEIKKDKVTLDVKNIQLEHWNSPKITLAVSILKSEDRFEWIMEKATELGVWSIIPIVCQRTENKRFRKDRLEKIIMAASKQSLRSFLPILSDPIPLEKMLFTSPFYFGHCLDELPRVSLKSINIKHDEMILIGPEGDFNAEEIRFLSQKGGTAFHLGEQRLRTETAAIGSLSLRLL
jgi:16S rRNA (uracil1498-N3)-methyltransferase